MLMIDPLLLTTLLSPLARIVSSAPTPWMHPHAPFPWWGYEVTLALHHPNTVYPGEIKVGAVFIHRGGAFAVESKVKTGKEGEVPWQAVAGEGLRNLGVRFLEYPAQEKIGRGKMTRAGVLMIEIIVSDLSDLERFCEYGQRGWSYLGGERKKRKKKRAAGK